MDEYINKEKLIESILNLYLPGENVNFHSCSKEGDPLIGKFQLRDHISNFPPAEVVEVRHGKWIENPHSSGLTMYCCSICGVGRFVEVNYCPNCGADMREGK